MALSEIMFFKKKLMLIKETYLESTSWVKNNCRGQSTEYSRAMPSHPSRDSSEEALPCEIIPEFVS